LMAVAAIGLWTLAQRDRWQRAFWFVIPLAGVAIWAMYLRVRFPGAAAAGVDALGFPFAGLLEAIPFWMDHPAYLTTGLVVVGAMTLLVAQVLRGRRDSLAIAALGFVFLSLFMSVRVWTAAFDVTRAVVPVLTAVIVNPASPLLQSRRGLRSPLTI
jgi:hypothetical protein